MAVRFGDAAFFGDIAERAAIVMVENVAIEREAARSTIHSYSAVEAIRVGTGFRSCIEIELKVVSDKKVQPSIVVHVDKSAAGVITNTILRESEFCRNILKSFPAYVVIQHVLSPVSDKQVRIAIIIVIASADPLGPTFPCEA